MDIPDFASVVPFDYRYDTIKFDKDPPTIYRNAFWKHRQKRRLRIIEQLIFAFYPSVLFYLIMHHFYDWSWREHHKYVFIFYAGIVILRYLHILLFYYRPFTKNWNDESTCPNPWLYFVRPINGMIEVTDARLGLFTYRKRFPPEKVSLKIHERGATLYAGWHRIHYPSFYLAQSDGILLNNLPWPGEDFEADKISPDWSDIDYSKGNDWFTRRLIVENSLNRLTLFFPY